ncbi:MAG: pyruvate carboxylase [Lewinellaceae bacterium]|nr:pyruvate carboxylase [Lewinellaceae bacterium]
MGPEKKKFKRLLVANRGEIAIRILRAASELNIETVSIYTFEDRYSLHRYKADKAYQVGKDDDPLRPYLDIEEIIRVAKYCRADAIHPGYGFLSENVQFVKRCQEEGIVFVGPAAEVMENVGDKIAAKRLAQRVEVPIIEGKISSLEDPAEAIAAANQIGFPVIVKAAAGGGGRGMRVVRSAEDLTAALETAKREAKTAFGDDTVFIEKFIENPKHIEVQLLGDHHGNLVHLFERDCSVQRRYQKVVEIAPSLTIIPATLQKIYDYAIRIGQGVNYNNAGTVEFLVDQDQSVYFIEVNPRIQVEHTITEEITGIDLVRSQILIAQGFALNDPQIGIYNQASIHKEGYAIQCRVTTEDPSNEFKPDYGSIIAYRSPGGFGIRLDAGSAYPGAIISPFFDSLLVKVTASGRTLSDAADRLHRALREFRVRGLKTNIGFLLNLLKDETFRQGAATVNYIKDHPELLEPPKWRDRGTKMLKYLAEVIVNGNPDIKGADPAKTFLKPQIPETSRKQFPEGTRDLLKKLGREGFLGWIKAQKTIQYTDTTYRDAHQSLLATRMRTLDLLEAAENYAKMHGGDLFSVEMWGGATFDVAMRFLREDPWQRLQKLRQAMPNVLLQMLLRGSNGVGYSAYPNNLIERFVVKAWENGIDVFRIFDSLNWLDAMLPSLRTVREETDALAEVCMCYTGDILDPKRTKFTLQYYLDLARRIEDSGAHLLGIKDMAGLLKPLAAEQLISSLRERIDIPIHLHTHDTSSIQAATYLKAIDAGVDIVDVAISSMSGLTSQPNFNSMVAMLNGHPREKSMDLDSLNLFADYWEGVRTYYYPFETELRAGTAEVYENEIPGGQYSNLRPQARAQGLEEKFHIIKKNYRIVNDLFGDIVKVTPSSKVVGDMALFMTANNLTAEDILTKGESLAFPQSAKELMRGDLGQIDGGFPKKIQKIILQGEKPYTEHPNAHLTPIDFESSMEAMRDKLGEEVTELDLLSWLLYDKVFEQYYEHINRFGDVSKIPTLPFFYGLKANEELMVELGEGKQVIIKFLNVTEANEQGNRLVFFRLNGQARAIEVHDKSLHKEIKRNRKATNANQIGAPLQGSIAKILVKPGDEVELNTPLFTIEAMKMESTIAAPKPGKVKEVFLDEKTLVEQNDLVVEMDYTSS